MKVIIFLRMNRARIHEQEAKRSKSRGSILPVEIAFNEKASREMSGRAVQREIKRTLVNASVTWIG